MEEDEVVYPPKFVSNSGPSYATKCSFNGLAAARIESQPAPNTSHASSSPMTKSTHVPFHGRITHRPPVEPPGFYRKLFDCYFCGDEVVSSDPTTRPSHVDGLGHYLTSPSCFWKCLRSAEMVTDKIIKVCGASLIRPCFV